MKHDPQNILPQSLPPRGLSREQAAAYIGISPSFFDMLDQGRQDARAHTHQLANGLG